MTLEQAFRRIEVKGFVRLRSLVTNHIDTLDLFKYVGYKGYEASIDERSYPAGGKYLVVQMMEKDSHCSEMELTGKLRCGIPKDSINKCLHWKECHYGDICEKARCESKMSKLQ